MEHWEEHIIYGTNLYNIKDYSLCFHFIKLIRIYWKFAYSYS